MWISNADKIENSNEPDRSPALLNLSASKAEANTPNIRAMDAPVITCYRTSALK